MPKINKKTKPYHSFFNLTNSPQQVSLLTFCLMIGFINFALTWNTGYNIFRPLQSTALPVVKGVSTQSNLVDLEKLTLNYQNQLKVILFDYLSGRFEVADLINHNSQTIDRIVALEVPAKYQKLHLELVSLLTAENLHLTDHQPNQTLILNQTEKRFKEIINLYPWLNL